MKLIAKPSVGDHLREIMKRKNLTWQALAEPLQLKTEEAVGMLLDDKIRIVIKRVPALATALKIDKALVIVDLLEVTISRKGRQKR